MKYSKEYLEGYNAVRTTGCGNIESPYFNMHNKQDEDWQQGWFAGRMSLTVNVRIVRHLYELGEMIPKHFNSW